jgi:hypothetical protein
MDHDRLFKELLTTFFVYFVERFVPDVAVYLEREGLQFLDKEVFTDVAAAGDRHEVDLLVKARFSGREAFFLILVENQASAQSDFPARMFSYFARLHEKFRLPIYPIVLFSYDVPLRPEPSRYQVQFPNRTVLDFSYEVIQLNRLNWRDYLRSPSPVAAALMTRMQIAPEDRPKVKLECLRMLVTLKLDPARATLISAFMNSYLKLTAAEHLAYNRAVEAIMPPEREAVMAWTNEWIEQGIEQGIERGREQGLALGSHTARIDVLARLLRRRFGAEIATATFISRLGELSDTQLDNLAEALLDFQSLADAEAWLASRA